MDDDDVGSGRSRYRPAQYWTDRLGKDFSLRGVGHHGFSERYNQWIYRQKRIAIGRVLPHAGAGARALDVGSGVGWVVQELRSRGWQVDGADISSLAVERLRQRFEGSDFFEVALGADPLPSADASYHLVTILDVTYHVVDDQLWEAGVRELARVLSPDGHLVVLDRFGLTDDDAAAHVRFRSRARWEQVCASAGLGLDALEPAYRWLSRESDRGAMSVLPNRLRGPADFVLEQIAPRAPHMRVARFARSGARDV